MDEITRGKNDVVVRKHPVGDGTAERMTGRQTGAGRRLREKKTSKERRKRPKEQKKKSQILTKEKSRLV